MNYLRSDYQNRDQSIEQNIFLWRSAHHSNIIKWQMRQSGLKSGGRGPGSKNFGFLGKFSKNLDSFRQFHTQKIDFSGPFPKNLGFFQVISQKN